MDLLCHEKTKLLFAKGKKSLSQKKNPYPPTENQIVAALVFVLL